MSIVVFNEMAKTIPRIIQSGQKRRLLDGGVQMWMEVCIIIHMWLHHSNGCTQFSCRGNLKQKK